MRARSRRIATLTLALAVIAARAGCASPQRVRLFQVDAVTVIFGPVDVAARCPLDTRVHVRLAVARS